ncbi:helix-turn-helix domain-containing protein, partial [Burkholderia sp. Ac-20379]|uniref:helix-turn-helix domain-containing protein n=1 Tax=Burkholderia sp. Ac-20379 TaxID=2703900 RepID=UPI001D1C889E
ARVRDAADAARIVAPVVSTLARHRWPGNVRELQNVIERIAVELAEDDGGGDGLALPPDALRAIAPELFAPGEMADTDTLAAPTNAAPTLHERRRRVEADEIRAVLDACGGDRERACAVLGISKTTLWRKLAAASNTASGPGSRPEPGTGSGATPPKRRR